MTLALVHASCHAGSFSTDFDGRGLGGSISVPSFRPSNPGTRGSDRYADYAYERYIAQQQEAARLEAERARVQAEIDAARRAQDMQRLGDLNERLNRLWAGDSNENKRYQLKKRIIEELEPRFREEQQRERSRQSSALQRLMNEADRIRVPAPTVRYSVVFIGGTTYTPQEARDDQARRATSPFTGKPFDLIVGPAESATLAVDLIRASVDHILSDRDRLSLSSMARVGDLKDKIVDEIVCHSNGCIVARALIKSGFVKGVKRLRVLAGDGAITNLDALNELRASTPGLRISVYCAVGDPVCLTPTGWDLLKTARQIGGPLQSFDTVASITYQALGLKRHNGFDSSDAVQVQMLSPPVKDEPWPTIHDHRTYFGLIAGQRMIGALDDYGDLKSSVMIKAGR